MGNNKVYSLALVWSAFQETSNMNNVSVSNAVARELQFLRIMIQRTGIFLNIEPGDAPNADLGNLGCRMKYWGEIGAFFGGILGIFCGFVLSFMTKLGSLHMFDMLLCWVAMCLTGAIVAGGLSSLCARLFQFKLFCNGPLLPQAVNKPFLPSTSRP